MKISLRTQYFIYLIGNQCIVKYLQFSKETVWLKTNMIVEVREKVNNAAKPNKQKKQGECRIVKKGVVRRIVIPSHSKVVGVQKLILGVREEKTTQSQIFFLT